MTDQRTASPPAGEARTLWRDTALPQPPYPALAGDMEVDVVVIGAGYTGLSTALHLAEAGQNVAVVEMHQPGWGASGRNAAGWIASWPGQTPRQIEDRLGAERGGRMNRMLLEAAELVPDLVRRHDMDPEFRQDGIVMAAHNAAMESAIEDLARQWNERGGDVKVLGGAEIGNYVNSRRFRKGLLFQKSGTLNPLNYCRGLATAATRAGAKIFGESPVLDLERRGDRWVVSTAGGRVTAAQVVVATNAYLSHILPDVARLCYRLPVTVLASEPLEDRGQRFLPRAVPVADTDPADLFWLMVDGQGRLSGSLLPLVASSPALDDVARVFERKMQRIFGDHAPVSWSHAWSGYVDLVPDRIVRIHEAGPGLWAPIGYSGNGIITATGVGREMARLIIGGSAKACAVPVVKMKPVPMRRSLPFLLTTFAFPLVRLNTHLRY